MNIFMFPDLSLTEGTETALVPRRWYTLLDSNTLTSYSDTTALMTKEHIAPIIGWEGAVNMLEQWLVLLDVILGPPEPHPAIYKLSVLVEAADKISARLHAQAHHQPGMPATLIHLIQTELNKSFWKVFMRPLTVCWPHFVPPVWTLTTGQFRENLVPW